MICNYKFLAKQLKEKVEIRLTSKRRYTNIRDHFFKFKLRNVFPKIFLQQIVRIVITLF